MTSQIFFFSFAWDLKWIEQLDGRLDWSGRPDHATFANIVVIQDPFDIVYWIV